MKTLKIKQVGDVWIFDKIDELPIDPEMTKLANFQALAELPEQQAVNAEVIKKKNHYDKKTAAVNKCRHAQRLIRDKDIFLADAKTAEDRNKVNIAVQTAKTVEIAEQKKEVEHMAEIKACDIELKKLGDICKAKRTEHIKGNLIYSHPRANEVSIFPDGFDPVSVFEEWRALANKQIVVEFRTVEKDVIVSVDPDVENITAPFMEYVSHSQIEDFRGCQYFYHDGEKWIEEPVIDELGQTYKTVVADGFEEQAIEKRDLTGEQLNEIRIQGLTAEQKETEKAQAIDSAAGQAALMERKLVIQGSTAASALTASRASYQEQLTEIDGKYA